MTKPFLIVVFLLFFFCAFSQEEYNATSVTWIGAKEGLKQNTIKECVADKNGIIWLATEMGLYRYDGNVLKEVSDKKYPEISKQRIGLAKDATTGDIIFWTSPSDKIFTIHNNTIQEVIPIPKDSEKKALFIEGDNHYSSNLSLIKQATLAYMREPNFKLNKSKVSLIKIAIVKNTVYIPSENSILVFRNDKKIQRIKYKNAWYANALSFGSKLVIVDGVKVSLLDTSKNTFVPLQTDAVFRDFIQGIYGGKTSNFVNKFLFTSDKKHFFLYKGSIYQIKYSNNQLVSQFLFTSPSNEVQSIYYLKKDNIFFLGTITKGLAIVKPKNFNTITFEESVYNSTYSVVQSHEKRWSSASGWHYNTDTKETTVDKSLQRLNSWFLLPYNDSYYYQYGGDLIDIENNQHRNPFTLLEAEGNYNGFCYLDKMLWMSNGNGLYYKKNNTVYRDLFFDAYIKNRSVEKLVVYKNKLLIATTKGVVIYNPKTKEVTTVKGLEKVYARYIKLINDNDYWVGCYGDGLFLVHNNKAIKVQDEHLDVTSAHAIEEDTKGNLWISTNDGLFCVNKQDALQKILQHKKISIYKYTIDDGLLTNEFNGAGTYPSLKDSTGVIGFPCMKGFVWFRPERVPKHVYTGKIIINTIKVDGTEISPLHDNYIIPNEAQIINVDFSYPYYFNRENITVEYRFSFDEQWKKIEGTTIQFTRPKKGAFQLIFRVHTHGFSHSNDVVQAFNIQFEPKYYETTWFILLLLGGLFLVIFISFEIGLLLNRKREKALQRKIDEKTLELQETLSDLEVSKKEVEKSLVEKEILLKEIHHRVKNNLQLVITLLSYQSSKFKNKELNDFLESGTGRIVSMALIHENLYQTDNLGHIHFREYAESLIRNIIASLADDEHVTFTMNVDDVIFDVRRAIPLGLILNELVVNTIKHNYVSGNELHFSVDVKKVNSHYKITYKDPQSTMTQEDTKKSSFGLELIHLLAAQLKGKSTLSFTEGLTAVIEF